MTDAERSATAPSAAVLHLDQQVMAYLAGRVGTQERLRALEEALART